MQFTCTKDNFVRGLQLVSGVTSRPGNLPILSHVLVQASEAQVELITTNLELAVTAQVRAKVDTVGSFTVPAKTLSEFVSLLPDSQVKVVLENNALTVSCGSSKTTIKGVPADEFPVIPTVEGGERFVSGATKLKDALSQAAFATAKNDIRPELAGVFANFAAEGNARAIFAATDSYRLAERTMELESASADMQCILPSRTALEFIRVLGSATAESVQLGITENQIALSFEGVEVTSRLIDGTYPDYTQILPTDFETTAVFEKSALVQQIKAASLFTTTGINAMNVTFKPEENVATIASTSAQTGQHEASVDGDVIGKENTIVLNHKYVLDGINHLPDGDVEIKMNGADAPCLLKSKEDDTYIYLVMPIRQ